MGNTHPDVVHTRSQEVYFTIGHDRRRSCHSGRLEALWLKTLWVKSLLDIRAEVILAEGILARVNRYIVDERLELLCETGENIRDSCHQGGNVLHAILEPFQSIDCGVFTNAKFRSAVKAGADHQVVGKEGDALKCARKLKRHFEL